MFARSTLVVCAVSILWAQPPAERPSMFAGTHFFVGFMQNEIERGSSLRLQIALAARAPTTVRLRLPNEPQERLYQLKSGEYRWIALPPELEVRLQEQPVAAAVELRSDAPIVVYAFNSQATTTDAYTAIPVVNWGTEYRILSFPNDAYTPRPGDTTANRIRDMILRRSEWMVIAAYDSTVVTFVPRTRTARGKAAGVPHTVVLNRGECYLVQSDSTPKGLGDMTGTVVYSSKPIGVLSGHVRVSLPLNLPPDADTKDHLVEMLPPLSAVGQRYISTPFAVGTGDWFRAVALFPQTRLTLTRATGSTVQTVLQNAGDVADFPAEAAPILWEADKPFVLGQLMYSAITGGPQALVNPYLSFDPCMVVVPPLEQFVQQAHFFVPDTSLSGFNQFKRHWINLVVSADAVASLQLNGVLVSQRAPQLLTQQLPWRLNGTPYHWVQLPIAPGAIYELRCAQGAFAGILYGTGYVDSYAVVLGSGLLPPGSSDVTAPTFSAQYESCGAVTLVCQDSGSGIAWVQPLLDSTRNYRWDYTQPSRTEATLRARPVDLSQDGQLVVELRDNAGNRRLYRHQYWAPRLGWQPISVELLGVSPSGIRCQSLTVSNTGQDTVRIVALRAGDPRLFTQASLPLVLPPGGSGSLQLCFRPDGNLSPLVDSLRMETECGVLFAIPVSGTVDTIGLTAQGCQIGDILVGEQGVCWTYWVNTGNRPLTATAIRALTQEPAFTLDTAGLFPYRLSVGDTLRLRVRFQPPQRGVFQDTLVLETSPETGVAAYIGGRGVAPEVHDVSFDWGAHRIGTSSRSVLHLVNLGDAPTELVLVAEDTVPELGYTLPAGIYLEAGDTLSVPIWFTPTQRQLYVRRLRLQSSWSLHPPIFITLRGEGIAPELQAVAVDFDTVRLGAWRDTVAGVLTCGGNEAAIVDSLWLEGPEATAFAYTSPALPQRLAPGQSLALPLRFVPQRVGAHRAWLVLRHNGKPPYQSDTLWALLLGYGQTPPPVDTFHTRWAAWLEAASEVVACEPFSARLCLRNQGNTIVRCTGLQLRGAPVAALEPPLPQQLAPGDSLCFHLRLAGLPAGETAITLQLQLRSEYVFHDTLRAADSSWSHTFTVRAQAQRWRIDYVDTLALQPGTRAIMTVSGSLPNLDGTTPSARICVRLPSNWRAEVSAAEYFVLDAQGNLRRGVLSAPEEHPWGGCVHVAALPEAALRWQVRIPVEAFLGTEERSGIVCWVEPDSAACIVGDSADGELRLVDICGPRLRSITLRTVPLVRLLRVTPQPATDVLNVAVESSAPTTVVLQLLNLQGEQLHEWRVQLDEGVALRKFAVASVPSGVYCVRLRSAAGTQSFVVVIQR